MQHKHMNTEHRKYKLDAEFCYKFTDVVTNCIVYRNKIAK